jgi:hypothetical protein
MASGYPREGCLEHRIGTGSLLPAGVRWSADLMFDSPICQVGLTAWRVARRFGRRPSAEEVWLHEKWCLPSRASIRLAE